MPTRDVLPCPVSNRTGLPIVCVPKRLRVGTERHAAVCGRLALGGCPCRFGDQDGQRVAQLVRPAISGQSLIGIRVDHRPGRRLRVHGRGRNDPGIHTIGQYLLDNLHLPFVDHPCTYGRLGVVDQHRHDFAGIALGQWQSMRLMRSDAR